VLLDGLLPPIKFYDILCSPGRFPAAGRCQMQSYHFMAVAALHAELWLSPEHLKSWQSLRQRFNDRHDRAAVLGPVRSSGAHASGLVHSCRNRRPPDRAWALWEPQRNRWQVLGALSRAKVLYPLESHSRHLAQAPSARRSLPGCGAF